MKDGKISIIREKSAKILKVLTDSRRCQTIPQVIIRGSHLLLLYPCSGHNDTVCRRTTQCAAV